MVGDDILIRTAYGPSLAGATVPLDGTVPIGGVAQVGSLTVPYVGMPWSVVMAPSSGGNPGATPNRLRATLGLHGGGVTFDVDAPLTGGILVLPPSESLTLAVVVNNIFASLPGRTPSSQRVSFTPAHHGVPVQSMPLVYTAAMATVASAAQADYARPGLASSYRIVATSDPAGYSLAALQLAGATVVSADASSATTVFGAAWERTTWIPLSPLCNVIRVINASGVSKDYAVQWRIGDW